MNSLIGQLFLGPLDVIGDVHGEITALRNLLHQLGYSESGNHPENRRLAFVGDLIDRGPNSPAVVAWVQQLVQSKRAQCILGNHELNVMLGRRKLHNRWFYSESQAPDEPPQEPATESIRQQQLSFFRTLPLALERHDLRVVHACWQPEMIRTARRHDAVGQLYHESAMRIRQACEAQSDLDEVDVRLQMQNLNPVKIITSGPETRTARGQTIDGEQRFERRVRWWEDYDGIFCVFGHYSIRFGQPRGNSRSFCIDYGVGKRSQANRTTSIQPSEWKLAAVRFPERTVIFDDGSPSVPLGAA